MILLDDILKQKYEEIYSYEYNSYSKKIKKIVKHNKHYLIKPIMNEINNKNINYNELSDVKLFINIKSINFLFKILSNIGYNKYEMPYYQNIMY